MSDDTTRLSRQALASQRLRVPAIGQSTNLLLPENAARFLHREVSAPLRQREHLGAIFIDDTARAIAFSMPYRGYLGRVRIEARKILAPAIMVGAVGLIIFHNRPRGRCAVRKDASIARQVRLACELLSLRLLDYLVLGQGDVWTSLRHERRARFHSLGDDLPFPGRDGRAHVRPKYRNPEAPHQTWSGRGKMARWLRDKLEANEGARLEDFAIRE